MFWIKNGKQYREETSRKISWGHWFTFFNILWAIIIGSRYAFIIDWPDTLFGRLYFFVSLLGHFSFIVFAFYLLIIFPLSFIVKNNRTFRGLSVIFSTLCVTLLLVDTEVFSRFNLHLSSVVWNLLVNPENGELSRNWQIFFTAMPTILLLQMLFSRWSWEKLRSLERQKWLKAVGIFFVCAFTATHLIYAWADAYIYRPITMQKSNFPLSYPMTARSFLEKHGFLDKTQYSHTLEWEGRPEAAKIDYPKHALRFGEVKEKTNILLITVSGLRADAVRADKMPKLNAFAQQATRYINHYSTGNDNNSGLTGLFYGLTANYTDSLLSNKTRSVLMERLRQNNEYQIGLFSADQFKSPLFRQGIFPKNKLGARQGDNQSETARFIQWRKQAQQSDKPYFAYLSLSVETGLNETGYALALREIDSLLNEALTDESEDTLVIITAEHGYNFLNLDEKQQANYFARDEVQVPMIVRWSHLARGEIDKLTSHTDLLPALMKQVFRAENPVSDYAQGYDLFDAQQERNWVQAGNYRWNVIITPDGTQFHIDRRGNYQKYDRTYNKASSTHPPLGLFLEVFNQEDSFFEK
ncbi:DUF3413 domain-containing protein [Caviibacterium pharyngocola]|uniref:DUF3413 domain-containing protein n=1 Tax=Caviibacterium pharyngocola TaxID=28159 RepID=A0A2M8RYH0_9PAST|nr:DUF3413 domain-containing protein [Caviibacterium pharyngocola]PJG83937.1 hypothetical protein CVP04_02260 [Caviibacterium pharyngocola]